MNHQKRSNFQKACLPVYLLFASQHPNLNNLNVKPLALVSDVHLVITAASFFNIVNFFESKLKQ